MFLNPTKEYSFPKPNTSKRCSKHFEMEECAPVSTPMIVRCKLSMDDESPKLNSTLYSSIIRSLLYLTVSRSNILQVLGTVEIFQSAKKESHMQAVKRIFWYIRGTLDFGLWYPKSTYLTLTTYTYVDWEGSIDEKQAPVRVHFPRTLSCVLVKQKSIISFSFCS